MILNKIEIAKRQIDTAIELYFAQKDFVSIITLAGASEEILGNIIKGSGGKRMIDYLVDLDKHLTGNGRDFNIINKEINGVRNNLKHADTLEDKVEVCSDNANSMLARAVANYAIAKNEITPLMLKWYDHQKKIYTDLPEIERRDV